TSTLKKGTILYRIRKFENGVNFDDTSQWTPPPSRLQNRANHKGQAALYLGSTETVCLLEAHVHRNEKYVLATYECVDDIELSGFFTHNDNLYHHIAGVTLNACLIAPSRNETNKEIFEYLDDYYGDLQPDDIKDWKIDFDLPLQFAVVNKRNQYYETTNMIADVLHKRSSYGIRYSSCYLPLETLGIVCSDFNVVLYDKGLEKIRFLQAEVKTNDIIFSDVDFIKMVCKVAEEARKSKLE
ncbi:MAG: RES family NAD+ phosphorylase, partial [Clostridia bacterium]|nr:RES family NAD+ phosphorylase [Clostridia bacterium]